MTFMYELDQYSLDIYWMFKYEIHTSRLSKVVVRQTDIHDFGSNSLTAINS